MNILKIDYDLMNPGQKYDRIVAYLKGDVSWARPLASSWLIKTAKSAEQVRNDLLHIIDTNDKILVINVTGDRMAWYGLPQDVQDWIHANVAVYR